MSAFAINSDRVVTPEGVKAAFILIEDGLIKDVVPSLPEGYHAEIKDAKGKIVMAGVIDPHVHINEPGRTEWEGFDTATKSAIAGGITTLVDMPLNSSPVTTTKEAFDRKLDTTKDQLHTDCGFWGGVVPGNTFEIEPLIKRGVLGFKAFLVHSGIDEFPNVTEDDLRKAMPIIAKYGLPLLVHCELMPDHIPQTTDHSSVVNHTSYQLYLASRPRKWEDDAIALMIRLCEEFNCRVHIVHLSSSDSIEQIANAKQKSLPCLPDRQAAGRQGLPLTVETCPHYLYFSAEDIKEGQTQFKCAPPIREKENNQQLWQALKDGIIDFVATDHSPCPPAMKDLPAGKAGLQSGDFMKAWGGIASLQFSLPVLWTAAQKQGCSVSDIAKWFCENPSKIIGRENSKGRIQRGYDADLVVWDDKKSFTVTEDIILHKHQITPYLGEKLYGVVEQTYLGGEKVYGGGKFLHLNRGKILYP